MLISENGSHKILRAEKNSLPLSDRRALALFSAQNIEHYVRACVFSQG